LFSSSKTTSLKHAGDKCHLTGTRSPPSSLPFPTSVGSPEQEKREAQGIEDNGIYSPQAHAEMLYHVA
jgi:hypothetical protein